MEHLLVAARVQTNVQPKLLFLFHDGSFEGPNLHFVPIDRYWDRLTSDTLIYGIILDLLKGESKSRHEEFFEEWN